MDINKLIKKAYELDMQGKHAEADRITNNLIKIAQRMQLQENDVITVTHLNPKDPLRYYAIVITPYPDSVFAAYGADLDEAKYNLAKYNQRLDETMDDEMASMEFEENEMESYVMHFDFSEWNVDLIQKGEVTNTLKHSIFDLLKQEGLRQQDFKKTFNPSEPHIDEALIEQIGLDHGFRPLFLDDIRNDETGAIKHLIGCPKCHEAYMRKSLQRTQQTVQNNKARYEDWKKEQYPELQTQDEYGISHLF